jgi:hypothetical protein
VVLIENLDWKHSPVLIGDLIGNLDWTNTGIGADGFNVSCWFVW